MKTLILDYSKWRCGDEGEHKLGKGKTALLNDEGFLCCLGQFCLQLNAEIKEVDILNEGEPGDLKVSVPILNAEDDDEGNVYYASSGLSIASIDINDGKNTTVEKKIELLKNLFLVNDYEIEVINKPKTILL